MRAPAWSSPAFLLTAKTKASGGCDCWKRSTRRRIRSISTPSTWSRRCATRGSGLGRVRRVQGRQALGEQAGDVHLADPHTLGDLGLGEILDEAQPQYLLVALRQCGEVR